MNTERIKEIQQETAYPNSVSVQQALLKVWNECEQERVKNCSIPDIINSSLIDIKEICESTDELPANFSNEQARNCDDALNQIMRIVDDITP